MHIVYTYNLGINKPSQVSIVLSPYQVIESIFQTAIGYSPVVQLFCTVIKRSASSCHVTHLQRAGIHNKMPIDQLTEQKGKLYKST